jgi:hypothetical protein
MASVAALILIAVSAPPPTDLTAEQAMAQYHALLEGGIDAGSAKETCPTGVESGIIICGRRPKRPQPRLPMPDERAEPGEPVHHLGEPKRAAETLNDKPACQSNCGPPASPETWHRLLNILGGKDPD